MSDMFPHYGLDTVAFKTVKFQSEIILYFNAMISGPACICNLKQLFFL